MGPFFACAEQFCGLAWRIERWTCDQELIHAFDADPDALRPAAPDRPDVKIRNYGLGRVGIASGLGLNSPPRSSCLQTLIFE